MRKLDTEIHYKGFVYKQESRNKDYAVYSQWLENDLLGYEVIKIQKYPAGERFGKYYEAAEGYPGDKSWGKEGWTFKTMKQVCIFLNDICPELAEIVSIQNGGGTFKGQAYIGQGLGK